MLRHAVKSLLLTAALVACGGDDGPRLNDDLTYTGVAGTPVPASFDGIVPAVDVSIDGAAPAQRFLIDTGAPVTILDRDSFPALVDGQHTVAMDAFGLTFPTVAVGSWDLFDQAPADAEAGIIGGDVLRHFAFSLDYRGGRAWLADPYDAAFPGDQPVGARLDVPVDVAGGGLGRLPPGDVVNVPATRVLLQVQFEGQTAPVWALVDSGASFVVLEESYLESLGDMAGRPRLDGVQVTTAQGVVAAYVSRVWRGTVSGPDSDGTSGVTAAVDDLPILVVPGTGLFASLEQEVGLPVQAFVGGSFLRRFLTTFDYQTSTLRLAPYADTAHIDPREFVGMGAVLSRAADGVWQVANVYPGTDAAAQLLVVGDRVVEIAGTVITDQSSDFVQLLLDGYTVGERVPLGVTRGGMTQPFQVLVEDLLPSYPPPP